MAKHDKSEDQAPEPTEATVEAGPDPIIEAGDKAVADLDLDEVDVERTTYVSQGTVIEEPDKADEVPIEGATSEEDSGS